MLNLRLRSRFLLSSILLLLLFAFCGQALAESCSYREGIMALQQGNQVRGLALLRMASRDGDVRASRYLLALQSAEKKIASPILAQLTLR